MKKILCTLIVLAFLALVSFAAAATENRFIETNGNAAGPCEVALPQFEPLVRQRPLAIVNESDSTVFISCAFEAPTNSHGRVYFAAIAKNYSLQYKYLTCTGIVGSDNGGAEYEVKTIAINPGGRAQVTWEVPEEAKQSNTSFQCAVPP